MSKSLRHVLQRIADLRDDLGQPLRLLERTQQTCIGLAIADAASLKRSELVYDDDTGFWCVEGQGHRESMGETDETLISISMVFLE